MMLQLCMPLLWYFAGSASGGMKMMTSGIAIILTVWIITQSQTSSAPTGKRGVIKMEQLEIWKPVSGYEGLFALMMVMSFLPPGKPQDIMDLM